MCLFDLKSLPTDRKTKADNQILNRLCTGLVQSQRSRELVQWTHRICAGVPPEVALVMAHAASFLVRNSAFWRISMSTGKMLASITFYKEKEYCKLHLIATSLQKLDTIPS